MCFCCYTAVKNRTFGVERLHSGLNRGNNGWAGKRLIVAFTPHHTPPPSQYNHSVSLAHLATAIDQRVFKSVSNWLSPQLLTVRLSAAASVQSCRRWWAPKKWSNRPGIHFENFCNQTAFPGFIHDFSWKTICPISHRGSTQEISFCFVIKDDRWRCLAQHEFSGTSWD